MFNSTMPLGLTSAKKLRRVDKARTRRSLVLTPKLSGKDGISAVARLCCAALASAGDSVAVCSISDPPQASHDGIAMHAAAGSKLRFTAQAIGQYCRRPDLCLCLHVHLAPVALAALPVDCQLVVFLHGIEAWKPLTGLRATLIRRASMVIANSHYTAKMFRSCNPELSRVSIEICPLAVENIPAPPIYRSNNYALIVGRLQQDERYKGHDQLLEIWPDIVNRFPGFKLIVAGQGNDLERLRCKASSVGVGDSVVFVGQIDDKQLLELYFGCSFFIMPSCGEGFGLVFLEAMRAGKACIAGEGAAEEIVVDGITGRVVDPKDPEQLKLALTQLLADPGACNRMGVAGRQRYLEIFTEHHFARRFLKLLGSTLDQLACVA